MIAKYNHPPLSDTEEVCCGELNMSDQLAGNKRSVPKDRLLLRF